MNKISCSVGYHRCTVSNGSYVRFRIPSKIRFCNSENQHHKQNLTHSTATPATVFTGKIALLNMYVNRYRAIIKVTISTARLIAEKKQQLSKEETNKIPCTVGYHRCTEAGARRKHYEQP